MLERKTMVHEGTDPTMIDKKFAAKILLLGVFVAAVVVALVFEAYGTPSRPKAGERVVDETYQNPQTYLLALPVDGKILDGRFTNIRFQPYGTALLYDQSILFCGDVADEFVTSGVIVVAYKTQASGRYQGIGCHELTGVFELKGAK